MFQFETFFTKKTYFLYCNLSNSKKVSTLINGSPQPMLGEHPIIAKYEVQVQWKLPGLDLMELANKYWIQNWSLEKLGKYFGRAPETIRKEICYQRVVANKGDKVWASLVKKEKNIN